MPDLLQDARRKVIAERQGNQSSTVLASPIKPTASPAETVTIKPPARSEIAAARKLAARRGLTGGAQNVFEKLETGQTGAIRAVDPSIIAKAEAERVTPKQAGLIAPIQTPTTPTPEVQEPTPELFPLFGETQAVPELDETFDRGFFDPLALFTERSAQQQLGRLEEFETKQEGLIGEEATARDFALEQRRQTAEATRAAERNVTGLEQQALLKQIDRSKRASFNQLRGQLASMGAFGTTGAGELDFAVLGEIYEGKSIDVRVAANKGLRDIEIAYFQILNSIESDQSKSDIEKAQARQDLNEKALTDWQDIQQNKQDTIISLAEEAFGIGTEEEKRARDQTLDIIKRTLDAGQQVSDALLRDAGYKD